MNKKVVIAISVLMLFMTVGQVYSQTIVQVRPGLYCAGVPTNEFEYFAAPETSGRQHQTNWCWAACIQMVLNYHGIKVTQEEIVTRVFGGLIDAPAQPQVLLAALSGWGVNANGAPVMVSASPIVFKGSDIVADLAYHWPMIIGLTNPGGISHACVLTAVYYNVDTATNEPIFQGVVIRDPWPMRQSRIEMSWAEFVSRLMFVARVRVTRMN